MIHSTILFGLTTLLTFFSRPETPVTEEVFSGKASFYSKRFEGKKTAFGEVFTNSEFTAAHRTLPHNTLLELTNPKNGNNVVVRVNDRGPWVKHHMIDISQAAAKELGIIQHGVAVVEARVVGSEGKLYEHEEPRLSEVFRRNRR